MAPDDTAVSSAQRKRGFHEFCFPQADDLAAHQSGVGGPPSDRNRGYHDHHTATQRECNEHGKDERGNAQAQIGETHPEFSHPAANVPGHEAHTAAERDRKHYGKSANDERDATAEKHSAEYVPPQIVRSKDVISSG